MLGFQACSGCVSAGCRVLWLFASRSGPFAAWAPTTMRKVLEPCLLCDTQSWLLAFVTVLRALWCSLSRLILGKL